MIWALSSDKSIHGMGIMSSCFHLEDTAVLSLEMVAPPGGFSQKSCYMEEKSAGWHQTPVEREAKGPEHCRGGCRERGVWSQQQRRPWDRAPS